MKKLTTKYKSITALSKDNALWHTPSFTSAPAPIAHEYHALYELAAKGECYPLLVKLRDVLELFARFGVLCCAALDRKAKLSAGASPEDAYSLIKSIIKNKAVLGTCEQILDQTKLNDNIVLPDELRRLTDALCELKKSGTANFRNDYIGHGAYIAEATDELLAMLAKILKALAKALNECEPLWKTLTISIKDSKQTGAKAVDRPAFKSGAVTVTAGGEQAALDKLILFEDKRWYFLDGFSRGDNRAEYLCFADGEHLYRGDEQLRSLYRAYDNGSATDRMESLEDSTIPEAVSSAFDESANLAIDFVEDKGITKQIKELMNTHDRGIIGLVGGACSGKSAYCAALDPMLSPYTEIELADTTMRCYYGSRSALRKGRDFANFTTEIFSLKYDSESHRRKVAYDIAMSADSKHYQPGQASTAADIAGVLGEWRERGERKDGKHRLLYVIDGVDYLTTACPHCAELIPTQEMLPNGVYILLTSRKETAYKAIGTIHIGEKDTANLVDDYIKLVAENSEVRLPMFSGAGIKDMKTAYLTAAVMRYDGAKALRMNRKTLVNRYLDILAQMYGKALFARAEALINVLKKARQPMTVQDICRAAGEGSVTLLAIGILRDFECLMNKQPSKNGAVYRLIV